MDEPTAELPDLDCLDPRPAPGPTYAEVFYAIYRAGDPSEPGFPLRVVEGLPPHYTAAQIEAALAVPASPHAGSIG